MTAPILLTDAQMQRFIAHGYLLLQTQLPESFHRGIYEKFDALVAPDVTDDPVFGHLTQLRLEQFFDAGRLKHLRELKPQRILVTNRSPDKATAVAQECGGQAIAWEQLDDALVDADIVLSTTGAALGLRSWS